MKNIIDKNRLIYCDYIANLIKNNIMLSDMHQLLDRVGNVQLDLDEKGQYQSTTKTLHIQDKNGNMYQVIVMEANND